MRIHGLLLACMLATAGCHPADTAVRLMVRLGNAPAPQQLRVTVYGARGTLAPPTMIEHPSLPGTITMHELSSSLAELCVALEGMASDGTVTSRGAVAIGVLPGMTANAAVDLGNTAMLACPSAGGDGGGGGGGSDMARDGGTPDLSGGDMPAAVAVCPAGSLFCDDFETGDIRNWDAHEIKFDMGSQIDVQQATVRHGKYALHVAASSPNPAGIVSTRTIVIKGLPSVNPPIAVRANVFAVQPLDHFGVTVELYDDTVHGFGTEGDNANLWTITEDQATGGGMDRHSGVTFTTGQWHCVEIVLDPTGIVSFYVDGTLMVPAFMRMSAVAYTTFQVGIGRTINAANDVYIDDVAVGPARLYCP